MKQLKTQNSKFKTFVFICILCGLISGSGCETSQPGAIQQPKDDTGLGRVSAYSSYGPAKISITPLTGFMPSAEYEDEFVLRVYVSLLDRFGCQQKWPGVFRFELYERLLRSAEPKGKRIFLWDDIDLTEAVKNDEHWQDFLRAYQFDLNFEPQSIQGYILEVTYFSPGGKRLLTDYIIK